MMVALSGGIPTVLASNQCQPEGAKVDGAGIYWADVCADSVSTVALGGGTITTLATGQAKLGGLVLGPSTIYWTSSTGVMSVPK